MKSRILLMLILLTAFQSTSFSQCLSLIRNSNGDIWGYLDDTSIYDNSSDKILDFSVSGIVGDGYGGTLATFNTETGEVHNQNDELIMTVEADGDILDGQGDLSAHIDEFGIMRDLDNAILVSIAGAQPLWIAYYYFHYRYY